MNPILSFMRVGNNLLNTDKVIMIEGIGHGDSLTIHLEGNLAVVVTDASEMTKIRTSLTVDTVSLINAELYDLDDEELMEELSDAMLGYDSSTDKIQ